MPVTPAAAAAEYQAFPPCPTAAAATDQCYLHGVTALRVSAAFDGKPAQHSPARCQGSRLQETAAGDR